MSIKIVGVKASTNRATTSTGVTFCLHIPNHILHSWYCTATTSTDYIDLVNKSIEHGAVKISSTATRLHERICAKASYISHEYKKKNWRKRSEYLLKCTYLDVKDDEVVNVNKLETRLQQLNNSVDSYR